MVEGTNPEPVRSKCNAISTLLPYSVFLEQGGRPEMLDAVIDAFRASHLLRPLWNHALPYLRSLLSRPNHPPLHRAIILTSPYMDWRKLCDESMVSRWVRWVAATSAAAYTDVVGQSVVDTLLQIARVDHLRPHIPVDIWTWLKKRPSLPPVCWGRRWGTDFDMVHQIRELGDIEILKSYFLLVWSEWHWVYDCGFDEMKIAISEDFGGIGMWCHQEDLIERLDYVLGQLEQGWEFLQLRNSEVSEWLVKSAQWQYKELKETLLGVDRKATETLTRASLKLTHLNRCANSCAY